ncbi:C40 family peptidase [uncultured Anaerococcus sp.]|uniref:C40 family peptidase n=1 Tax=uncultured Anaerococcus sp. TaxID=293428 RepID=UPI002889AD45|nr:C40 family peptidase [uncultured Anaerococcus sp.]
MSKKNIGAALTVIVASAAVATAYAATVTDLENDKHTNSLITEENKEVESSRSFVKSDYTKEVKNTKIAGIKRNSKKASQEIKQDIIIEKTAKTLVQPKIVKAEKKAEEKDLKEKEDKKLVAKQEESQDKVVSYDDKDLDDLIEEKAQQEVKDVVSYDDKKIDDLSSNKAKADQAPVATQKQVEKKVQVPVISDKFVNVPTLNIRASKDATSSTNIVRTIKAGDKLVGHVEGNWFVTTEGYISLAHLANYYPQDLVNQIKAQEEAKRLEAEAKKAKEAKAAEEARIAEEARKASEAKKAVEAKKAEEAKKAAEAKKAQEAQKQQVKQTVKQTIKQTEQVVEQQAINYQAPVGQGAQGAVNAASQFIGSAYVWGAADPNVGFDCSGLTAYAYKQVGVNLPHNSAAQFNNGYAVDVNNLQVGDLVFFSFGGESIDHVGIVTGSDGSFIHASTPQTGVRYDNIFNGSFQNAYRGARRIY